MRILLVDSHILFREGLASLLEDYPDLKVVGQLGCAADVFPHVDETRPEVILMEVSLPDGRGLDLIQPLCAHWPDIKVIVLTGIDDKETLFLALRSGAKGYILKDSSITTVVTSLRAVARNEVALTRAMTSLVLEELSRVDSIFYRDHPGLDSLTSREREILTLIGKNLSNQEIASKLNITVNTAKVHVHKVLEKLQLQNRREAASLARRHLLGSNNHTFFSNEEERKE